VIVVGGGPAGLSAALVLGRCRRRVLVIDEGQPRNARARALHGFLTRDGLPPRQLLRIARDQLRRYRTVALRPGAVAGIRRRAGGFEVETAGAGRQRARFVLLATGVVDHLPALTGLHRYYGRGVYHCPYCDGWENRGLPLVAYGRGAHGSGLAQDLLAWSSDVALCTDGSRLPRPMRERLARLGIGVHQARIARLRGRPGRLERIELADGRTVPCRALFLSTGQHQRSALADRLGCAFTGKGALKTTRFEMTNVPGLFAAGDCSQDVQFVVVAAAEGARAAVAMNKRLIRRDLVARAARRAGKRDGPAQRAARRSRRSA
jgi:thioredoxin reductase